MTRTTKRFLSIVLTAMMLFTFIPTSALAVLEDADDIDYDEAAEVLVALGAIDGTEYDVYYPPNTLQRDQAAKLIAYLMLGDNVVPTTDAYMYLMGENEDEEYIGIDARERSDHGWEFYLTDLGRYEIQFFYGNDDRDMTTAVINVSEEGSASSEQTMYTVAVAGTTVNAKKVVPGTEVEASDFSDAVAAVTPTGDSVQGLYFDADFTQPANGKFTVNSNTTLYPKLTLASNKTELILNANGEGEALQVTGATGTTVTYTASGIQVDVSQQDQAKLVTMAQANTGKANNTVYLMTAPAKKANLTDIVADRWSAGSIEYAANLGIIDGQGNGQFNPGTNLTGTEFAKMMLVALGYNADKEQLTDTDWALNASALGFLGGLEGDLTQPLSREDIAQMVFNTLTEEQITFSFDASTARDMAAAGADLTVVTGSGTAIIDNENLKKVGEAVKYTITNGEQYVDKKVQLTIAKDKVAIAKDGEPATAVKAAYTAFSDIGYVGTVDNTVYTTVITDGNRVESLNTIDWSNKDMAEITTQRGSQGNTRIITTSDSMLEELTGMKR